MKGELAHSYTLGLCGNPKCTALHFELLRENDEVFAVMTIAVENVPKTVEVMQDLAYQIAATRKD